ncbi:hypothetical protein ACOMHN_019521 [Nucella lapillus]
MLLSPRASGSPIALWVLILCPLLLCTTATGQYRWTRQSNEVQCRRRERWFLKTYQCLRRFYKSFACWLHLNVMEKLGCREPCFKYDDQRCLPSGDSCLEMEGLCDGGKKCCLDVHHKP